MSTLPDWIDTAGKPYGQYVALNADDAGPMYVMVSWNDTGYSVGTVSPTTAADCQRSGTRFVSQRLYPMSGTFPGGPERVPAHRSTPAFAELITSVAGVDGRTFNVILARDPHTDRPSVRFYDASQDPERFTRYGQFVSSYYVSDALTWTAHKLGHGLNLDGGTPEWSLPAASVAAVVDALRSHYGPVEVI